MRIYNILRNPTHRATQFIIPDPKKQEEEKNEVNRSNPCNLLIVLSIAVLLQHNPSTYVRLRIRFVVMRRPTMSKRCRCVAADRKRTL